MAIDRSLCLLMTDDLIDRFDDLERKFSEVRRQLPHLWDSPRLQELTSELEKIRGLMERPRYYVGFLGRSQVGKSSTLNSILRPKPGEEPCTGGQGAPATSTVTRIRRRKEGEGDPKVAHLCNLRYMTPFQFRERRDALCQLLGFDANDSDDSLRVRLESLLNREEANPQDQPPTAHIDKIEDYKYLLKLLRTYHELGKIVTDPPKEEPGDFERRSDYTNHPKGQEPWPYLMLREVELGYRTEEISDKIELIDLPGLGARMASDDELTRAFLPNLDGALIFQSSEQVAAKEAYDLLTRLRELYPRLKGRVWMVITRFDAVSRTSLGYGASTTILDNVQKTMIDNKVPLTQVVLVGNEFHRQLVMADGTIRPPTEDNYRLTLNLDIDESGRPSLPQGFDRHAELKDAYEAVLEDGGIGRVRQIIGRTLADEVEREVRDDVDARLKRLRIDLKRQVQAAKEASKMDGRSFEKIVDWKVQLQRIQQLLDRERKIVEKPFLELIGHLRTQFTRLCPADYMIPPDRLLETHRDYVRVLTDSSLLQSRVETLPQVYDSVGGLVGEAEGRVGKVRFGNLDSPLMAWRDSHDQDMADLGWYRAELQEFDKPPLFTDGEEPHLRDHQYRAIMDRKIDSVCQRLSFVVSRRICKHLRNLIDGLALIDSNNGYTGESDDRAYDELLNHLD